MRAEVETEHRRAVVRSLAGDVALALAVAVAGFVAAANYHGTMPAVLFVLAAIGTLPLAVRRLFPLPVLAIVVAVATSVGLAYHHGWWPFAAIVALYTVAAQCPRPTAAIAGAASLLALAAPIAYEVDWSPFGWNDVALVGGRFAPLVIAWLLGDNLRTRRAYLRAVEERAAQLEREQESNARRAAAEEQARIAREVHDVVAHNLSVIIVQATAADAIFESDPRDAQHAVRTIGTTARRALDELRHVLGSEQPALAPQPTLRRLDGLLDQVRAAGLDVQLDVVGERRELPPALELSAYRIVQEALTNTLRHAGAEHASVTLRFGADELEVEVVDDGSAPRAPARASGRGLIGMRERATRFGGDVEAGRRDGGGFRVRARLPLTAVAR
ncbi:MAG TPA: histidine kinase [Gaiellaceae bacterium]|nr:histidine kinase [Gaiellaceae bacterium]